MGFRIRGRCGSCPEGADLACCRWVCTPLFFSGGGGGLAVLAAGWWRGLAVLAAVWEGAGSSVLVYVGQG